MMTDPIADMLTRIRNANAMRHETVVVPSSKNKNCYVGCFKKRKAILQISKFQRTLRVLQL